VLPIPWFHVQDNVFDRRDDRVLPKQCRTYDRHEERDGETHPDRPKQAFGEEDSISTEQDTIPRISMIERMSVTARHVRITRETCICQRTPIKIRYMEVFIIIIKIMEKPWK
jgi:hypothetical protein